MKNASLVVVAVALLVGGCLREEVLPELVMVDGFADQPAALKFDPEELLAFWPGPAHNRRASPLAAMTQDEARADSNFLSESDR